MVHVRLLLNLVRPSGELIDKVSRYANPTYICWRPDSLEARIRHLYLILCRLDPKIHPE